MGGQERFAADLIDGFLRASKELQGVGRWKDGGQHGEARIVWPILVNGEMSRFATLVLKAYPRKRLPQFRLVLNAPSALARIDFDCEPYHINSMPRPGRPYDLPSRVGPRHYHAWADNRHLATQRALPKELLNARDLPLKVRNFTDAQRWFCEEVGIRLAHGQVADLPPSDTLL